MNILLKVRNRLLNSQHPERIFLSPDEYWEFQEEMEPIYKKKYGSLICDIKAAEEGFQNILYNGRAICYDDRVWGRKDR